MQVNKSFRSLCARAVLSLCLCLGGAAAAQARLVNRIVAIVNGEVITQSELEMRIHDLMKMQGQEIPLEQLPPEAFQAALKQMVDQELIAQQAEKLGIKVNSDEVTSKIRELKDNLPSEKAYKEWLKSKGMSVELLRRNIRKQIAAQKAVDQHIRPQIIVTPQEMNRAKALLEEAAATQRVRLRHILIRVNESRSAEEARQKLAAIQERILQGESFTESAKAESEDANAADGGLMGWVEQGQLLPELDAAAFSMEVGGVSDIIQSRLGFHLLYVEDTEQKDPEALGDLSEQAFMRAYEEKFNARMEAWLEQLMEESFVEIPKSVLGR